jgi:predicted nucleotidyltransferase
MSKPLVLTEKNWAVLHRQLAKDHPSSVMLIREKMKAVLGFTVRRHTDWVLAPNAKKHCPEEKICLDFYNEPKRTMFLLKYSHLINCDSNI